ncbi:SCO family protein [Aureimonas altamirensis]|uniref:SCO family protein n=1 Tax=Aureimonas altamirensis TaxID=370622 RepID=UPI002036670B|nr:SCO family protein [Aureimonas altamirensis]MCM2503863.1 SCO family protein [Aureimonas altamirensis]
MTSRSNRLLAIGGLATLMSFLVGVLAYTAIARPSGKPDAPFQLTSTRGESVDQTVFKGRPSLVYFGYTHCPEVCPTTLYEMSGWLHELGAEGDRLQALFFTIDPERDTPEVLGPYVEAFSDRITGITGDKAEMRKVLDAWLVTASENAAGESYSMSHTMSVFLVGADGRLKGMLPYEVTMEDAVARIRDLLLKDGASGRVAANR